MSETTIDLRVLGFTLALSLLTSLLFGLLPALHAARTDLVGSLRDGGRPSATRGTNAMRSVLGAVEVALALVLVLLIGAGLMIKSLYKLTLVEPGFRASGAVVVGFVPPGKRTHARGFPLYRLFPCITSLHGHPTICVPPPSTIFGLTSAPSRLSLRSTRFAQRGCIPACAGMPIPGESDHRRTPRGVVNVLDTRVTRSFESDIR